MNFVRIWRKTQTRQGHPAKSAQSSSNGVAVLEHYQGTITKRERAELERLVEKAEKISLHNARALVEYRRRKAEKAEGTGVGCKRPSGKESETALLA